MLWPGNSLKTVNYMAHPVSFLSLRETVLHCMMSSVLEAIISNILSTFLVDLSGKVNPLVTLSSLEV